MTPDGAEDNTSSSSIVSGLKQSFMPKRPSSQGHLAGSLHYAEHLQSITINSSIILLLPFANEHKSSASDFVAVGKRKNYCFHHLN